MLYSLHILDYLDPVNIHEISNDEEYKDGQVGKLISVYEEDFPDLSQADLILVGCRKKEVPGVRGPCSTDRIASGASFTSSTIGIAKSDWWMWVISNPAPPWLTPMRHSAL